MKTVDSDYILDQIETETIRSDTISAEKVHKIISDAPKVTGIDWNRLSHEIEPPEDQALLISFANISYPLTGYYKDGIFYLTCVCVDMKNIAFRDLGYVVNGWCLAPQNI